MIKKTKIVFSLSAAALIGAAWVAVLLLSGPRAVEQYSTYGMAVSVHEMQVPAFRPELTVVNGGQEQEHDFTVYAAVVRPEHSARRRQSRDATVILSGGPGSSGIAMINKQLGGFLLGLAQDQDVIVLEQRGTGRSEPDPLPDELVPINNEEASADAVMEDHLQTVRDFEAPLDGISSREAAADIRDWADHLGYRNLTLYGISYGTRIAMTAADMFPERIHALLLDSPVAVESDYHLDLAQNGEEVIDAFFAQVQQQADNGGGFDGLQEDYLAFRSRLQDAPLAIRLPASPEIGTVHLTADMLDNLVFNMLYASTRIPYLPRDLRRLFDGNAQGFEYSLYGLNTYHTKSTATQLMWLANDGAALFNEQQVLEETATAATHYPGMIERQLLRLKDLVTLRESGVLALQVPEEHPLPPAGIPVLIMAGELDPITTLSGSRTLHDQIPDSQLVEIPQGGHGVAPLYARIVDAVVAFRDNPHSDTALETLQGIRPPGYLRF